MTIYKKLLEVQKVGVKADKDGKNPHFKSNYVTLDNLLSVILPIATEQGVAITNVFKAGYIVTTVTDVDSGEYITSEFAIHNEKPQEIGSAGTYGKRYNLGAIFNLITEVDDDGNMSSHVYDKKAVQTPAKSKTPVGSPLTPVSQSVLDAIKAAIDAGSITSVEQAISKAKQKYLVDKSAENKIAALFA